MLKTHTFNFMTPCIIHRAQQKIMILILIQDYQSTHRMINSQPPIEHPVKLNAK